MKQHKHPLSTLLMLTAALTHFGVKMRELVMQCADTDDG